MPSSGTPSRFATKLRAELVRRDWGIRTLARHMDPDNVERARRSVNRWLHDSREPSRASRRSVADALGVPEDFFDEDDEEESVADMLQSIAGTFNALAQRMENVA